MSLFVFQVIIPQPKGRRWRKSLETAIAHPNIFYDYDVTMVSGRQKKDGQWQDIIAITVTDTYWWTEAHLSDRRRVATAMSTELTRMLGIKEEPTMVFLIEKPHQDSKSLMAN